MYLMQKRIPNLSQGQFTFHQRGLVVRRRQDGRGSSGKKHVTRLSFKPN